MPYPETGLEEAPCPRSDTATTRRPEGIAERSVGRNATSQSPRKKHDTRNAEAALAPVRHRQPAAEREHGHIANSTAAGLALGRG